MPDQRALAQLLRLGSAPREDALLQAEMQRAAQLAQPRGRQYGTAGGAIMGALSDGVRGMVGGFRQNDLARQAKEAMAGEVDARQQWLMADAQKRAAARAALLRGQPPPADAMSLEQSPQEQAAGMAAALRGEAPQPDALTQLAPYQPGPLLGGGATPVGTPAAPLAPIAVQTGEPAPIGGLLPGDALRAKLTEAAPYQAPTMDRNPSAFASDRYGVTLPTPTREMERSQRPPEAKMAAPAAAPQAPEMPDLSPEQYAEYAIASGDPAMMAWGKTVLEQANLRATLGAKSDSERAAAAAKAKADEDAQKGKQFDDMLQLRAQFNGLDEVKKIKAAKEALDRMKSAGENGTGDLVRIYGFMRQLDPLGSVRQDDFANVGRAGGLPSQVQAYFDVLQGKGALSEPMRRQIENQSFAVYKAQLKTVQPTLDAYKGYEADAGFKPGSIVPDYGLTAQPMKPPPPAALEDKSGRRLIRQTDGTYEVE